MSLNGTTTPLGRPLKPYMTYNPTTTVTAAQLDDDVRKVVHAIDFYLPAAASNPVEIRAGVSAADRIIHRLAAGESWRMEFGSGYTIKLEHVWLRATSGTEAIEVTAWA